VGFINTTGIRAPLAAGTVTYEHLFLVHPFGNRVVRGTMTGALLREMLEHSFGTDGRTGVNAHVAGLQVEYDLGRPAGNRITALRLANGRAVQPGARYTVATLDYLAQGGSGYTMLTRVPWTDAGATDIDNLVAYLRGLPAPLVAPTEIRIRPAGAR
jgi:5'-nucleotidase